MFWRDLKVVCVVLGLATVCTQALGATFYVGAATADITPEQPAALSGQFHLRISTAIETPISASVVGLCGAAGDQSPHLMIRKAAEERMRRLRGLGRLDEIARRVVRAVDDAYEVVKNDRHTDVPVVHRVETVELPMRLVTEDEFAEAKAGVDAASVKIKQDPKSADREHRRMKWYQATVDRFERQKTEPNPVLEMELHVVRIGGAVICTNQFELFTDFGIRIKARSKAEQTFVVQLVGPGTYLPTARAEQGGHYSAIVHSSHVGSKGGQVLVDKTVELIDAAWASEK